MPIQLPSVGLAAAALLVAALVALITTPVVRSLAVRMGAVDVPKDGRRMHDHPIPRMGGLALLESCRTTLPGLPGLSFGSRLWPLA